MHQGSREMGRVTGHIKQGQQGFTLIELSVVLAIVGLLVGGGLMATGPMFERARIQQTQQNLDQIESALTLFAIRHDRLPCPADGALAANQANYGQEQTAATGCAITDRRAVLPWATLGLQDGLSVDGWSRRFSYVASPSLTGPDHPLRRHGTDYPSGSLKVISPATPPIEVTPADRAAYVVISHGHDGAFGWMKGGGRIPASGPRHPLEDANGSGDPSAAFVQGGENSTPGSNHFDDVVRWRTAAFLIQSCGAGACGNP